MSALEFLARAISTLSDVGGRPLPKLDDGASYEGILLDAARLCRGERLPVRHIIWASGPRTRARSPWDIEWLDGRWLVRTAGEDLVVSVTLPHGARRWTSRAINWWLTTTRAFDAIVAAESDGVRPLRTVRFVVSRDETSAGRPPRGWQSPSRLQEVEVAFEPDGSVRLQADGFLAAVLSYFSYHTANTELTWISPVGTARVVCPGEGGERLAAQLVLATSLWWRLADFAAVFPVFSWILSWTTRFHQKEVDAHPLALVIDREAVAAYLLEARLKELHRLARIFGEEPGSEEEVAGWCREIEAAIRQSTDPFEGDPAEQATGKATSLHWPTLKLGRNPVDATRHYIAGVNGEELEGGDLQGEGSRASTRRLLTLADGERSLAEIALRLTVEYGIDWESAATVASRWVREGRLVGLEKTLSSRTLLYFSYGSCMCRPSFRETIPRFELIGEAVLKGYRLGFTHRSVVRAGGVADVVPTEGSEVRGVLYRIPRVSLRELDEREGVSTGHYRREWVDVEALGVRFENVLTFTVVNKSPRDIPPSPEYAGLIVDGARGLLANEYIAGLEAILESMGVEPEIPL